MIDIMEMLFINILQWPNYTSYATGNVMKDLVMLFLLPTIMLIVFVWVLTDAVNILSYNKMIKLLTGVGIYLFIIFEGLYPIFAIAVKTYFIILIFVFGIIYFVIRHFTGGNEHAFTLGGGGNSGKGGDEVDISSLKHSNLIKSAVKQCIGKTKHVTNPDLAETEQILTDEWRDRDKEVQSALDQGGKPGELVNQREDLRKKINDIRAALGKGRVSSKDLRE